ncbi:PREDICTED: uncharacterized protein LOC108369079 [Rhagoletis zephyria]|uniref:uncharacterized protein LOC108369079 n=1 Tax=Rhagoletis zephyria TaxID=28612 RepID=UPI000811A796|nr:PREDICTED: uncharacterized protein LOC108369079 [Rhagoletis zephyria]
MFSKEPELDRFPYRKELSYLPTTLHRNSLDSGSRDSLEGHLNPTSPRLKAGANNTAERRVTNVVMTPSACKSNPPGLHHFKPNTKVNVVEMKLNHNAIKEESPVHHYTYCQFFQEAKRKKSKTRGTQSLYRESSTQTLPFLPEVSNKDNELEQIELSKLPTILPGDGPPGLYQVEVLERARKRWAFARALKENFRQQIDEVKVKAKQSEHGVVLQAFEWEHWIEREEYLQECQMLRLEILIGMFNKREQKIQETSKTRIERSYDQILARRDASLYKNQLKYEREMRQLEIKRRRVPKCWRRENILSQLGTPTSEFYGPELRYGVNPSRRHFVGGREEFEARMDDLEKRAVKFSKLVCSFTKLKEWAKPKQRFLEIEQNFCSDENLQKMYETLTSLRKQAVKQKVVPKCLIQKIKQKVKDEVKKPIKANENIVEESNDIEDVTKDKVNEEELQRTDDTEFRQSIEAKKQRAQYLMEELYNEDLEAMIQEYEGYTIGWLMRFLSEEMGRLQEQRLLHYITMLAQKERWLREAAEAGLRQKENEMRQIYEQIYIDSYDSCRSYLNMILEKDIPNISHEKAEVEVLDMARVIDADIQRWLDSFYAIQNPLNYYSLRHNLKTIIFNNVDDILKAVETKQSVKYVIEMLFIDVFEKLEPYDIGSYAANELVDRLFDLDLYYFSSEENSTCSCLACECPESEREIRALIRKLIRQAVPGRRWKTPVERLAKETVKDLIDGAINLAMSSGSDFESGSIERFCRLRLSPSYLNLFSPSKPHSFDSFSTDESESIIHIVQSDFPWIREELPLKHKSTESSGSYRQLMPEAFVLESSEDTDTDKGYIKDKTEVKDKSSAKFLKLIHKELLNFLSSGEESESLEVEDLFSTTRSVQSDSSDACGLGLIIEEIINKISTFEDTTKGPRKMSEIVETVTREPYFITENEIAEIYKKSAPLELITQTSNETSAELSEKERVEKDIGSKQQLTSKTYNMTQELETDSHQNVDDTDTESTNGPETLPQRGQQELTSREVSHSRSDSMKKSSLITRDGQQSGTLRVRISEKEEKMEFVKPHSTIPVEELVGRRETSSLKSVQTSDEVAPENNK